jgi:hypothetical protein
VSAREAALAALAEGRALTAIRLSALTGRGERYCSNVLGRLHAEGLTDREPYRSGKGGCPAWEHRSPKHPKPKPCCPHCGGEL